MKNIFLFLIFVVFTFRTYAQELIISEETITESYLLRYENSADKSQQVINYILGEITRMNKRNRQNDQIIFSYNQTTRITRKEKQINIYLNIKNFRTTTNTGYRGFPLTDVLLPSKIDMSLQLNNKNNQPLAAYNVDGADFNSDRNEFTFRYTDTNNLKDFKLIIKSKKFTYTERGRSNFQNKLADIDRYYDFNAKMSMAFDDMAGINPDDLDRLFDYDNMLKNIDRLINDIEGYRMEQRLNLRDADPGHFKQKLQDLKFEADRQHGIINHTISILYQIYYNRALEALVNGNEPMAVTLFEKSLYNNPIFAPSALQLAKIDFKNNRIDEAASKVRDIYARMNPDPQTANMSMDLVNLIYDKYLNTGESLLDEKSYQQALEVFYKTRDFCRSIPGFYCSENLSNDIAEAKHGIYSTFLDKSRDYLKSGDLLMAEKEVKKAMDYFNANPSELKSNAEAIGVMNEIKSQEYANLISQGKLFLKAKNYSAAFKTLQEAEALEGKYTISKNAELPGLLKQAAKPVILTDIKSGFEMVNQNQIEDAKKIVISSYSYQNSYNLSDDKDISRQLEDLRKKIFTRECINAQNQFDVHLENARNNLSNKYYLLADNDFKAAFKVADDYHNCMIDVSEATRLKSGVQPAIDFLNGMLKIDLDTKNRNYANAINAYIEIEKGFNNDNIAGRYGLSMLPLMDYISKQENGFVIYAINFFILAKNYENSLKLMDLIHSRGAKNKLVKNEQKLLGTQLAIRDHAKNPSDNYKQRVLDYSRGDKWYNNLLSSYKKQWKKLK
jgi:hypothetical protein